jgi:ATP-dependent helicase/nuclease subunit A
MKHTPAQLSAIEAEGNVLVVAGAGTGKTRTLIDRCMSQLLDPSQKTSLMDFLMVTFTESAATEMRERIARRLNETLETNPHDPVIQEQLAHIDAASIGTLHSFCLRLIRQHFHALDLDPQMRVMESEELSTLQGQVLDELLEEQYASKENFAAAVRRYVHDFELGWDQGMREWILKIHAFSQAMVDPSTWLNQHIQALTKEDPTRWRDWLLEGGKQFIQAWLPVLESQSPENTNAATCLDLVRACDQGDGSLQTLGLCLRGLLERDQKQHWPPRSKQKHREPIEGLFEDAHFLAPLCWIKGNEKDPLEEDWHWFREQAVVLLQLAQLFNARFSRKKRERGGLEFSDLEQHALTLLWNRETSTPTPLAGMVQSQFKYIYVDEYQDINAAQDAILTSIAGTGSSANRFLVGDVKQSIYRFRLASPKYFARYEAQWGQEQEQSQVIYLQDNFRSRPGILNFVNRCFSDLMGSIPDALPYPPTAHLKFGAPEVREVSLDPDEVSVECQFVLKENEITGQEAQERVHTPFSATEQEAWSIATRLRDILNSERLVEDLQTGQARRVEWRDMAILMRSPRMKFQAYSRIFDQLSIPLESSRGGLFECTETSDLVSLLQILDNPGQDIPMLAVLRSPLFEFTENELAIVRIPTRHASIWHALNRLQTHSGTDLLPEPIREHPAKETTLKKTERFLQLFNQWRQKGRQLCLSRRLEGILEDSLYMEGLVAAGRSREAMNRVQELLRLARQFDQYLQQGLHRFLQYIQKKMELEEPFQPSLAGHGVRLLSIHKSKGLEFPVVVIAGLGGAFPLKDIQTTWLLDQEMGISGMIQAPGSGPRYPSLPLWIARKKIRRENLQEEMRLLYVAFTRARDLLILSGLTSVKNLEKGVKLGISSSAGVVHSGRMHSPMDWLIPWLSALFGDTQWWQSPEGMANGVRWALQPTSPRASQENKTSQAETAPSVPPASPYWLKPWQKRSDWEYPYLAAISHPAKATVTMLRKHHSQETLPTDAVAWFNERTRTEVFKNPHTPGPNAGVRGTMHHHFLQWVDLNQVLNMDGLTQQCEHMIQTGHLDATAKDTLNFQAITDFWSGNIGQEIQKHYKYVQREMPFTVRFALDELKDIGLSQHTDSAHEKDFVLIQGIIDLAVIRPDFIQVLDYKTDQIGPEDLTPRIEKYRVQVELYARALQRIYQRPVVNKWIHFLAIGRTVEL